VGGGGGGVGGGLGGAGGGGGGVGGGGVFGGCERKSMHRPLSYCQRGHYGENWEENSRWDRLTAENGEVKREEDEEKGAGGRRSRGAGIDGQY